MLNEGLLEEQVGLVTAMKCPLLPGGLCKVFIGRWEEEAPGTRGAVRGHRTPLQLPSSASGITGQMLCVPGTDVTAF